MIQGGSSGRGTLFVDVNLKAPPLNKLLVLNTKAQFLLQCQQKAVLLDQMDNPVQ